MEPAPRELPDACLAEEIVPMSPAGRIAVEFVLSPILVVGLIAANAFGDMTADSPVKFPERGALPAKFPPDQRSQQRETPEEGCYIFTTPERSLGQIAKIQAEMPKGEFTPPKPDWSRLPRTRRILTEGGDLCLLAMGDSIVNDTMRSAWVAKLREAYPKATIRAMVYVRGGGGCRHYKEEGRLAKHVIPRKPDLVFIGGISQGGDVESIRTVVRELRAALPEVEILLATGVFGTADPRVPEELNNAPHSGTGVYGASLRQLAREERCTYLDMTTPWAEYIRSAKGHPHQFYRDRVHANEYGEQILSKILMAFFQPWPMH
ncbi:MAG: SGNH/GDSL hydrolase family protein [Planctomycetota bacterium]|jgi:lysophospholipase L1-like esterase